MRSISLIDCQAVFIDIEIIQQVRLVSLRHFYRNARSMGFQTKLFENVVSQLVRENVYMRLSWWEQLLRTSLSPPLQFHTQLG